MRRAAGPLVLGLIVALCSGHIGSPDVWYEGGAGPYHVVVVVRLPGVVPGIARVAVRAEASSGPPDEVTLSVNRFDATASPPAEPAVRDPVDRAAFEGTLWVMGAGSNAVTVTARGRAGTGSAVVPVVAVASRRLPLYRWLGVVLSVIGAALFLGAISIVGAAVREGTLPPGETPDAERRRRARRAMVATGVVVCTALYAGKTWWSDEDAAFRRQMYRPLAARAAVGTGPVLTLTILDSSWIHREDTAWARSRGAPRWSPLIPDHGKLMHLFVIGAGPNPGFAHLHPTTVDSVTFTAPLPPLGTGRYRVFADIVHQSGFDQTVASDIDVRAPSALRAGTAAAPADSDDSWTTTAPVPITEPVALVDGVVVRAIGPSAAVAGRDAGLRFVVETLDGRPEPLAPYMGMTGHAVVEREDGGVFIHLHPMGTISTAAQLAFVAREEGDTAAAAGRTARGTTSRAATAGSGGMAMGAPAGDTVSFPYAFPEAGRYRLWVQVKAGGRIVTAPFLIDVGEPVGPGQQATNRATTKSVTNVSRAPENVPRAAGTGSFSRS